MIGTRLGHYRVLGPLGAGGMGVVYRAHDEVLERDVALKFVRPEAEDDPRARTRLLREARMASALQHAHICTVFEVAEEGAQTFIVMELVQGRTLARMLKTGPLELAQLYRLGSQIAGAVAHAHAHGVIHRDLKSANVIVTDADDAKVLDFGLARQHVGEAGATASMSATTGVAGTAAYMAPETLLGRESDAASDIWALGVALYEMAAGALPFAGSTWYELSNNVLNGTPKPLPAQVPAALSGLIERCLEKNRERRIGRAEDVREALESLAAGATPAGLEPRRHVSRWGAVAIALGALVVVATGSLLIGRGCARTGSSGAIRSLAVLPLENLTGDPQQEYFADGMTDELINTLARLPELRVISNMSARRYRGTHKRVRDIAHELGVDAIIVGSVARGGDQVRISARLIRGSDDQNLWGNEFRGELSDVLTLQGDVGAAVAQQIKLTLSPAERAIVSPRRAVNPEAYEAVLRGRKALDLPTRSNASSARVYFEKAVSIDPGMASAHAGLARSLMQLGDFEGDSQQYRKAGRAAALRAVALDDGLPEAHTALAAVFMEWDSDWDRAYREFERSVSLNPSNVEAHLQMGFYYRYRGDAKRDRDEMRMATILDPLNGYGVMQMGWAEFFAHRYADAARMFSTALVMDSTSSPGRVGLGLALEQLRQYDQAILELSHAAPADHAPSYFASLGHALGVAGRTREARAILDTLSTPHPGFTPSPEDLALVQLALGQRQEALRNIEAAAREHSGGWIQFLRVDPRLDPVRSEPGFQRALEYMHLSDRDIRPATKSTTDRSS